METLDPGGQAEGLTFTGEGDDGGEAPGSRENRLREQHQRDLAEHERDEKRAKERAPTHQDVYGNGPFGAKLIYPRPWGLMSTGTRVWDHGHKITTNRKELNEAAILAILRAAQKKNPGWTKLYVQSSSLLGSPDPKLGRQIQMVASKHGIPVQVMIGRRFKEPESAPGYEHMKDRGADALPGESRAGQRDTPDPPEPDRSHSAAFNRSTRDGSEPPDPPRPDGQGPSPGGSGGSRPTAPVVPAGGTKNEASRINLNP